MTEHTPGPWTVDSDDPRMVELPSDNPSITFLTFAGTKAQAHLIAAAPDLLTALEGLTNDIDAGYDHRDIDTSDARAAIAKARNQ